MLNQLCLFSSMIFFNSHCAPIIASHKAIYKILVLLYIIIHVLFKLKSIEFHNRYIAIFSRYDTILDRYFMGMYKYLRIQKVLQYTILSV